MNIKNNEMHAGTENARLKKVASATWKVRVAIWSVDTHGEKRANIFSLGALIMRIVSKLVSGG